MASELLRGVLPFGIGIVAIGGVVFIFIGVVGCFNSKFLEIKTLNTFKRILLIMFGILFILPAVYHGWSFARPKKYDNWVGFWETKWAAGQPITYGDESISIIQFKKGENDSITGRYEFQDENRRVIGKIRATQFANNILRGEWTVSTATGRYLESGTLEFLMFSDGDSFIGRYSARVRPYDSFQIWKGTRKQDKD